MGAIHELVDKRAANKDIDEATLAVLSPRFMEIFSGLSLQPETECWVWTGTLSHGYGILGLAGRSYGAHRISYQLNAGPAGDGMYVAHKCDNKRCVNPAHLEAATPGKNTRDAFNRGLIAIRKGDESASAKMTEGQVRLAIEECRRTGDGYRKIGRRLGLPLSALKDALSGRSWQHLNGGKPVATVLHYNSRESRQVRVKPAVAPVTLKEILASYEVIRLRIRRYGIEPSQPRPIAELAFHDGSMTGEIIDGGTKWAADAKSCLRAGYQTILVMLGESLSTTEAAS